MHFTFVSPSVVRLLGYDAEEAMAMTMEQILPPDSLKVVEKALAEGLATKRVGRKAPPQSLTLELEMRRKDGSTVWTEVKVDFLRGSKGRALELLGVTRDIADRKRAEKQLRNSNEQLRALTARLQTAREEERANIAREIHDELGQALTGLKIDLAWLRKKLPTESKDLIKKTGVMSTLIDSTIQSLRKISSDLRPGILDDLGLPAAIEWQAQEFQKRTGIDCQFTGSRKDLSLEKDLSTAVFRIFQETLTNVARHARASRVEVDLKEEKGILSLRVQDNGRGITEKEIQDGKSLGLLGMRERAFLFGGEFNIKGMQGKGTSVLLRIPVSNRKAS
jgi:PAS domain S-box-containing protein